MGIATKIQWCDSTVNPTMGCDGCELREVITRQNPEGVARRSCYAGTLHDRCKGQKGFAPTFEQVTLFPGRMAEAAAWSDLYGKNRPDKPWLNGRPRMIFVSDMSDALSNAASFDYLKSEIIDNVTSVDGRRHIWLWLTKRPARMSQFNQWLWSSEGVQWPKNLWPGTSITAQKHRDRYRELLDIYAPRFLSVEPQVESIVAGAFYGCAPHWVIQGGESGKDARVFDLEWADEMRRRCDRLGASYFLKQVGAKPVFNGKPLKLKDRHGGDWKEWPDDRFRIREVPTMIGMR